MAVFDHANWLQNLNTAVNTARQIQLEIQDLSVLSDLQAYQSLLLRATRLTGMVSQLSMRLLGRYNRWIALVPQGETIPCTAKGLVEWNAVYDQDTQFALLDAGVAQTLVQESQLMLEAIPGVMNMVLGIAGTVSGLQSLQTLMGDLVLAQTQTAAMRAPMDEQATRMAMRERVNQASMAIILENQLAGLRGVPKQTCSTVGL
jgi:hypothetical protein